MGAQRKLAEPALTAPLEDAAPIAVTAPEPELRRPAGGDVPTSPAILLQEQLAARLAQTEGGAGQVDQADGQKWPMAARIATIVGLSMALWGGIFLATVAIIT